MNIPGLVVTPSDADFARTVQRLEGAMAARCIAPAARIDHADGAHGAGLELAPTLLFVFGNPVLGTPLMQVHPTLGIDLPLKILIWQTNLSVFVAYDEPAWLVRRHGSLNGGDELSTMTTLLKTLSNIATGRHPGKKPEGLEAPGR